MIIIIIINKGRKILERNTRQKSLIINVLKSRHDHPTADMLYSAVREIMPEIGIATVYRNLVNAAESGEILRLPSLNGPDRFDGKAERHINLHCSVCGAVVDLFPTDKELAGINALLDGGEAEQVEIYGTCKACRRKGGKIK
jgi:Fur family peroxide stress response transcriptional regulator